MPKCRWPGFAAYSGDAQLALSSSPLPRRDHNHCVWLYFRFAMSFCVVEEMLAMRGVALTYETVREWCLKFGQTYANGLRHKSPRPGDIWHLDEVFLKINGRLHYLWHAVDQDGEVLNILVQRHRDRKYHQFASLTLTRDDNNVLGESQGTFPLT